MSKCDNCEKIGDCKIKEAFQAFERLGDANCYDYKCRSKDVQRLTNFDKITQSIESLTEFVYEQMEYCSIAETMPCEQPKHCTECLKEWLQKEAYNG